MDHSDLVAEIASVEKMTPMERLVHARKRRSYQLKLYRRYEKKIEKENTKKRKPGLLNNTKKPPKRHKKGSVNFVDNVKILEAAARNDIDEVHNLLLNNISPNLTNEDGLTALHQCCIDEREKLMLLLLKYDADVNARDSELWTPMHAAATCGHIHLCEILINHDADLLAVNADGNMPYDICDDEDTLDLIENEMAKRGITQEQIDDTRLATEKQMLHDLQLFVSQGGNLHSVRDQNGVTPLHIAAANGYLEVANYLLEQKIPVNIRDDDSWEPIHAAACWQESLMLDLLVEQGADIDSKTKKNDTPFDICDDPDIKQKILNMKDEQESQKRKTSTGSIRKSNRPNNRSASLRRSSMRGEKSALFMKEAKEEAAHFGMTALDPADDIAEEEDDEDDDTCVTSLDDVELIMDDMNDNEMVSNEPEPTTSAESKPPQNVAAPVEPVKRIIPPLRELGEGVRPASSFPSRTMGILSSSQSRSMSQGVSSLPKTSTVSISSQAQPIGATSQRTCTSITKPTINLTKSRITTEITTVPPSKMAAPKSPGVSALTQKFNAISTTTSNTNDIKPAPKSPGTVASKPGFNLSPLSSKSTTADTPSSSPQIPNQNSKTLTPPRVESAVARDTIINPFKLTERGKENTDPQQKQKPSTKLVAEIDSKGGVPTTRMATTATSKRPTQNSKMSSSEHTVAPRSSSISSLGMKTTGATGSKPLASEAAPTNAPKSRTIPDKISTKSQSPLTPSSSSSSPPAPVVTGSATTSLSPTAQTEKANHSKPSLKETMGPTAVVSTPKGTMGPAAVVSTTKGTMGPMAVVSTTKRTMDPTAVVSSSSETKNRKTVAKSTSEGESSNANIPNVQNETSRTAPIPGNDAGSVTTKPKPQSEPRYPTSGGGGGTLIDLKRQRMEKYGQRGSTGGAANNANGENPSLTAEMERIFLKNIVGNNSPSCSRSNTKSQNGHNSPSLSSKSPAPSASHPASTNCPVTTTNSTPSTWTPTLSNGNQSSVRKYSASSHVQVIGGDDDTKHRCCIII